MALRRSPKHHGMDGARVSIQKRKKKLKVGMAVIAKFVSRKSIPRSMPISKKSGRSRAKSATLFSIFDRVSANFVGQRVVAARRIAITSIEMLMHIVAVVALQLIKPEIDRSYYLSDLLRPIIERPSQSGLDTNTGLQDGILWFSKIILYVISTTGLSTG